MSDYPEFKPGNWKVFQYVRDNCDWPSGAKAVYKALFERWSDSPLYPSDATLAKDVGMTDRYIRKWRMWLAQYGLLDWHSGKEIGGSNTYTLAPPWAPIPPENRNAVIGGSERGSYPGRNVVPTRSERGSEGVGTRFLPGRNEVPRGSERGSYKGSKEGSKEGSTLRGESEGGGPASPSLIDSAWGGILDLYLVELLTLGRALVDDRRFDNLIASFARGPEAPAYAALAKETIDRASSVGKPALWLWSQAVIYLAGRPTEFDGTAATFAAAVRQVLRTGRLATGYPEWLSGAGWERWQLARGNGREARFAQDVRWYRALAQSTIETDEVYDLLCEAQEVDAQLTDDEGAQRFRLTELPADLRDRMAGCRDEVVAVLERAYRRERVQDPRGGADYIRRELTFREDLKAAMAGGDRSAVIALAAKEPTWSVEVAKRRGWVAAYPAMGEVLITAAEAALAAE